jgi:hypothetical protein
MDEMNRRDFVATALAGLTAAGTLAPSAADARQVRQRRNVYCLSATGPELGAYAKAVQVMQARPATDPTSWLAQANIHGTSAPQAGMISNACQHNTTFFLSWHRMYLHFFERIARQASGNANFALPYWGYSPTGARDLPAAFRDASSPLFNANRRASINTGTPLAASVVDAGPAMIHVGFNDFTNGINSTPHGVVHTGVGGFGGDMSAFETAGRDPIFWLHHANIDRLWELWLLSGGGRVNPTTNSAWMTQTFDFYDEKGATVTLTGAGVVDTATQLGYRYGSPLCLRPFDWRRWKLWTRVWPWEPVIVNFTRAMSRRQPAPEPRAIALVREITALSATPADVRLPIPPEERKRLQSFPTDARAGRELALVLEDITVEGAADVYYEIYVNLPAATRERVDYTSPHYVGNVDFFGTLPQDRRDGPPSRTFSLLPVYARLRAQKLWRDDAVQVTFVPRSYVEGRQPRQDLEGRRQATIGRVSIALR